MKRRTWHSPRMRCAYLVPAIAICVSAVRPALAQDVEGDVLPATFSTADYDLGVTTQAGTPDEFERGYNMVIGRTGTGSVRSAAGDFRWEHLILGGIDQLGGGTADGDIVDDDVRVMAFDSTNLMVGAPGVGTGTLRLQGQGTSFNNHPRLIPTRYQDIFPFLVGLVPGATGNDAQDTFFTILPSVDIDLNDDGTDDFTLLTQRRGSIQSGDAPVGFDAVIGLTGQGTLSMDTGAYMEIEDAFIVGWAPGSSGVVNVDGADTSLSVYGGLDPNNGGPAAYTPIRNSYATGADGVHQMIIGGYGHGQMHVTGGATVNAYYGAAIGVPRSDGDDDVTDQDFDDPGQPQGNGLVTVSGPGSSWNIAISVYDGDDPTQAGGGTGPGLDLDQQGGALAIGEWDANGNQTYSFDEMGQGTLVIADGGSVQATRFVSQTVTSVNDRIADVRIGRMGTLDLRGGSLYVTDQIHNDGAIRAVFDAQSAQGGVATGQSLIEAGTFNNRPLGTIEVGAGKSLRILSSIEPGQSDPDTLSDFGESITGANMGLIELTGHVSEGYAEFIYERAASPPLPPLVPGLTRTGGGTSYNDLFYNAGEVAGVRGQIVASESSLRFKDGLWNAGDLNFVGGHNLVDSPVMNAASILPAQAPGTITIANKSTVVFEDVVVNDGQITLSDDSNATFKGRSIAMAGDASGNVSYHGLGALNIVSTGDVHVEGDFLLGDTATDTGGTLRLMVEDFERDAFSHLVIQGNADFNFGSQAAEIEVLGNVTNPVALGDVMDLVTVLGTADFANINVTAVPALATPGLMFQVVPMANALALQVINEVVITSVAGDYNNDNVVDALDFAVWREAVAAGAVFGDLPNDPGLVGGPIGLAQYQVWLNNFGATFPAPGPAPVPEPAALGLLTLLGLGAVRRRRA